MERRGKGCRGRGIVEGTGKGVQVEGCRTRCAGYRVVGEGEKLYRRRRKELRRDRVNKQKS